MSDSTSAPMTEQRFTAREYQMVSVWCPRCGGLCHDLQGRADSACAICGGSGKVQVRSYVHGKKDARR